MPKRGGARVKNYRSEHFEHDDRAHNTTRRVSFKPGSYKGKNKFNVWNAAKLLDDDIDMGGSGNVNNRPNKSALRGRGGRLNSPIPRSLAVKRKFIHGILPWYQITIPYGAKHEKDVILRALLGYLSPEVFIPQYYKINGNAAIFYVDDVNVAEKLYYADRKITMSDGFKLIIIVRNTVPNDPIDDNLKEKMKLVIAKRYNAAFKALDLTKFHADPDLSDVFCAIFRPKIMMAAIDIIAENIPDLIALNLNDNKLHGLEHLKVLSTKLKSLNILYLGDNRIPYVGSLEPLKSLPLVELYLKGNPLVNKCKDHDIYISLYESSRDYCYCPFLSSDVRKKFPKLLKLDGEDLPPAIGFDVAEVALPARQQSFLVDPQGQDLVREFLTQYFAIYDSESRQQLLDAYHENAVMSMTANYSFSDTKLRRLNSYMSSSRNLLRVNDRECRRRYLRAGKLQLVTFLSELPKTKHDLMGFSVDLTVFTPTMILLTMNGVFKETKEDGQPTRAFHRTFVIVPNAGGGFCIMNDMLYITNTTREQEESCFKADLPPPAATPAQPPAMTASPDDAQKMQLLAALGQHTGMNQHWSMNCLQETGWDLQRALFIFNQLQSEGKIPPEAFVK